MIPSCLFGELHGVILTCLGTGRKAARVVLRDGGDVPGSLRADGES